MQLTMTISSMVTWSLGRFKKPICRAFILQLRILDPVHVKGIPDFFQIFLATGNWRQQVISAGGHLKSHPKLKLLKYHHVAYQSTANLMLIS